MAIAPATMFVDRVLVGSILSSGTTQILLDDLEVGPIVPANFVTHSDRSGAQIGSTGNEPTKVVPVE